MKSVAVIVTAVALAGCGLFSTERPSDWYYSGEATAIKNGEAWEARPYAASSDQTEFLDIIMHFENEDSALGESLWFPRVPKRVGRYPVATRMGSDGGDADIEISQYHTTRFGDVAGDSYRLVGSDEHFVEITNYDHRTGHVSARFGLTVAIHSRRTGPSAPDTIRFEQGRVDTQVVDEADL